MKEHRTKALRVTTPHSIENSSAGTKDEYMGRENANDLFGTLQILQFDWAPSRSNSPQSQNSFTAESDQSSSSHYSQPSAASEMMTTHTASFTANAAAFGKHDSFYRWFSSDFENHRQNSEEIRQYCSTDQDPNCCKCERDLKYNTTTCHCRSSFSKRKIKEKKFTSTCAIRSSLASFHAEHSYTIWDLISGNVSENWFLKVRDIKEAISREKAVCSKSEWYKLRDANGNTVLLVSGQKLLREGCFDKAVELVKLFLDEGADVNVINNENRTLLSYSVQYMDKSIRLTTLLINYGATVWPIPAEAAQLPLCSNSINSQKYGNGSNCNSAFTWFLKSIIRQLKLSDHCLRTLYVLAEVMGENPKRMHSHVMNTMFNHAKCYSILGPVFLQIKLAMSPYWTQPQSLKFLCKSVIRKSIIDVPGRCINAENISSLMLPPSLQSYLMLEY